MSEMDENIYYELKKSNSIMEMIFGALLIIAGTLIATLPYIVSYTKSNVEILSTKGGTYLLVSPAFTIFGSLLILLGFIIIIVAWIKYADSNIERKAQRMAGQYYANYPYFDENYQPSRENYFSYEEPANTDNTQNRSQIKKKKIKMTPDGRPIYRKRKIE